jgi:hypothetical protein
MIFSSYYTKNTRAFNNILYFSHSDKLFSLVSRSLQILFYVFIAFDFYAALYIWFLEDNFNKFKNVGVP